MPTSRAGCATTASSPPTQIRPIDTTFRKRAQAVQAVDEMIGDLRAALAAPRRSRDTYIVFSSDNGFHMGEHRLRRASRRRSRPTSACRWSSPDPACRTAGRLPQITENDRPLPDVRAAGAGQVPRSVDGRSLMPVLEGMQPTGWRQAVVIEHHGPDVTRGDPDFPGPFSGNPPSYKAMRTGAGTYVEYSNGDTSTTTCARIRTSSRTRQRASRRSPAGGCTPS